MYRWREDAVRNYEKIDMIIYLYPMSWEVAHNLYIHCIELVRLYTTIADLVCYLDHQTLNSLQTFLKQPSTSKVNKTRNFIKHTLIKTTTEGIVRVPTSVDGRICESAFVQSVN